MVGPAVTPAAIAIHDRQRFAASVNLKRTMESEIVGRMIEQSLTSRYSEWIVEALEELTDNFLITDPSISGHPIVFASRGFLKVFGYSWEEVIGRNGRMFQGPATDRRSVVEIREAIREERTMQIKLLNYRKDGTPMWILFHLCPVFGKDDGEVIHFVAVQVPIQRRCSRLGQRCLGGREIALSSCRMEVCGEAELAGNLSVDLFVGSENRGGLDVEESCEASDLEKQKAFNTANNILSKLTTYSKLTGRTVSGKPCSLVGVAHLGSSLNISLGRIKQSFVLTDPNLPDMPIVYASNAFLSLTGYSRNEVLGQNCRFLNGHGTNVEDLSQIRECIQAKRTCTLRILNYRKDGSSFWNLRHISPVRNASGKIAFYVWVMDADAKNNEQGLSLEMRQLGAVGAVKVAVRSLSAVLMWYKYVPISPTLSIKDIGEVQHRFDCN